ncbi:MAG TPA: hypothetical protein VH139_00590, partial [Acidobacteriaceae bacterium]|nr:hypothetical protein [Acidobacteriaceae bacterium]
GRMAATVLANLSGADRVEAFRTMIKLDAQQPASSGSWAFSGLVSQFYDSLPAQNVLTAIDTILQRAADVDLKRSGGQGNMSSGPNSFSYRTETDFQLFAVAPALQKLAPARAAALLQDHPDTAKWLDKYPRGLESFDQNHSFHGGTAVRPSALKPKDLLTFGYAAPSEISLLQTDYGLEFTRADFPAYIQPTGSGFFETFTDHNSPEYAAYKAVVNASHPDVLKALGDVPVLRKVASECSGPNGVWCSYTDTYPQAGLVGSLADNWTYAGKEENARAALQALPIELEKIPPQQRCALLADAADLYLRMGDGSSAYSAVRTGFSAAAQAATEEDAAYKQPAAQLLRPSEDCYHALISAGVNADFDSLRKAVDSLQNPALRAFATAMLARALLGVPLRRDLTVYAKGSFSSLGGLGSYSEF